jgi:hypothetical protein
MYEKRNMNNIGYGPSKKRKLEAKEVCVTGEYCLPKLAGNTGDVITVDVGGSTSFQPSQSGTLQSSYDISSVPQIITTGENLTIQGNINVTDGFITTPDLLVEDVLNITSGDVLINNYRLPTANGPNNTILTADSTGLSRWEAPPTRTLQSSYDVSSVPQIVTTGENLTIQGNLNVTDGFIMTPDLLVTDVLNITSGDVLINNYRLPTANGANNTILTADSTGLSKWTEPSITTLQEAYDVSSTPQITGNVTVNGGLNANTVQASRLTIGDNSSSSSVLNLDSSNGGSMNINFSQADSGLPILRYQLRYNGSYITLADVINGRQIFDTANSTFNVQTNLIVANGRNIQLGTDSNSTNCVLMKFLTSTLIEKGRVVKIVDDQGVAKIRKIAFDDSDKTGVIGVTSEASAINTNTNVCVGGVFEIAPQNGLTIRIGEYIEKSDDSSSINAGRAIGLVEPNIGTFGVALSSATGNAAGTTYIKGIYTKNEMF